MNLSIITLMLAFFFGESPKGKDQVVIIHTNFGDISLLLFDKTPKHKANFLKLAKEGFYDGTTFHRIIDGFMIQGGDPNTKDDDKSNDGLGGPDYSVPAELVKELTHRQGAIAAAREPDRSNPEKASSGSQFFIVENKDGYHSLDGNYTVFGEVIKGIEVVEKIAEQKKDRRNKPLEDIKITITIKKMSKKKIQKEYAYSY
ncbi:MAG: peptidylprolyl isomerase [Cyclobacteriaceae bacterium]|nr:peptidylprolyl isomerase [Cyclobacteriaceae bacterium]